MGKILVGYEFGLGMGHLARMLPIARALVRHGHQVLFFMQNPQECAKVMAEERLPLLSVMSMGKYIPEVGYPFKYHSYSDFMAGNGFYYPEHLFTVTLFWKTIFDNCKPDLIICDHSPNCCLSAFGRIPVIIIGDGFTLPPVHDPIFPVTRGATPIVDPDRLLENMRIVQKRHGMQIPQAITEPFRTKARFLCTLPEIDHYPLIRRDTVIGPPPGDMLEPIAPPSSARWFAYLKTNFAATRKVLESICCSTFPGEVYLPDLTSEWEEKLIQRSIIVHRDPPPMSQVLQRVSVVLHHGGNGLACAALSAGRPQVLVPIFLESELTGEQLRRIGVGQILTHQNDQLRKAADVMSEVAETAEAMERAQSVAHNIHLRGTERFLETCIDACERILTI